MTHKGGDLAIGVDKITEYIRRMEEILKHNP